MTYCLFPGWCTLPNRSEFTPVGVSSGSTLLVFEISVCYSLDKTFLKFCRSKFYCLLIQYFKDEQFNKRNKVLPESNIYKVIIL